MNNMHHWCLTPVNYKNLAKMSVNELGLNRTIIGLKESIPGIFHQFHPSLNRTIIGLKVIIRTYTTIIRDLCVFKIMAYLSGLYSVQYDIIITRQYQVSSLIIFNT
jgi:hypothetical protein